MQSKFLWENQEFGLSTATIRFITEPELLVTLTLLDRGYVGVFINAVIALLIEKMNHHCKFSPNPFGLNF